MERFVLLAGLIGLVFLFFLCQKLTLSNSGFALFRYKILEELGDGTCGSVYKAVNLETYEVVSC